MSPGGLERSDDLHYLCNGDRRSLLLRLLQLSDRDNFEPSPELLDEAKGLIDALRSGEGVDALLARHEEVMREFRLDAVYDHED